MRLQLTTPSATTPPRLRPRKPAPAVTVADPPPPAPPSLTDGEPLFLTVGQVAVKLHISHETVKRMVRRGELRGRRIGRCWRVEAASLREWLERGG